MGSNQPGQGGAGGARRTVLIVEDDAFLRAMYGFLLEQDGFAVLAAPDGPSALRIAGEHEHGIDLVIADYVMPGMGGFETWQRICTPGNEPDVLFLSGDPHQAHEALRAAGMQRPVLAKPFHPDAFLGVVHALVGPRAPSPAG